MRLLRPASEDDMVAIFLAAEVASERYGPQTRPLAAHAARDDLPADRREPPRRETAAAPHPARRARPGQPGRHRRPQAAHRAAAVPAVVAGRTERAAWHHRPPPQITAPAAVEDAGT